jgi:hypothetical protein
MSTATAITVGLEGMAEDLKGGIGRRRGQGCRRTKVKAEVLSTGEAKGVMTVFSFPLILVDRPAGDVDVIDEADFHKKVHRPINGIQADLGLPPPNPGVDFLDREGSSSLEDDLEDTRSLGSDLQSVLL